MRHLIICIVLSLCSACSSQPLQQHRASVSSRAPSNIPTPQPQRSIQSLARAQLGVPYRYGGNSPRQGFDCSGLVRYVHNQAGLNIPRSTREQYRSSTPVSLNKIKAGDLLFFRIRRSRADHVAIYLGKGRMIHAPSSGKAVEITSLNNPYWAKRLFAAGHF